MEVAGVETVRMAVCVVLGVVLFGVCLAWYRAVHRRFTHAEPTVRARARWEAYECIWSLCLIAGALALIAILLAAAYIKITDGSESTFEALVQIPIALLLAAALLSLKVRFAPWAVCVTGQWWLGSYALTGDFSFQTPLRVLFESFTDFLPDPLRWTWAVATLALITFTWIRVLDAKTDLAEVVA